MAEFSLSNNSKIVKGKYYKDKTGSKNIKKVDVYRWNPEDGKNPRRWIGWGKEAIGIARMFRQAIHPVLRSLGERCIVGFGSSGGPPMLNVLYNNNYQIVQSLENSEK